MKPIFDTLISTSLHDFFVDLIAETIQSEINNQIEIARNLNKNDAWIEKNIFFNVKNHEFRGADVTEMPCIYIYFDRSDYNSQTTVRYSSTNQLVIEIFASGINQENENGEIILSADKSADIRFGYLRSQVMQIMMSEAAENIRCKAGISSTIIKSFERTYYPQKDNLAESVMSGKFIFELEFSEKTKYLATTEIKELYITNHIRGRLMSILINEMN